MLCPVKAGGGLSTVAGQCTEVEILLEMNCSKQFVASCALSPRILMDNIVDALKWMIARYCCVCCNTTPSMT